MITLVGREGFAVYFGLSTEVKPDPTLNYGFIEIDTAKIYKGTGLVWLHIIPPIV